MDIQEYIQSGIIESYVLGIASAEEVAEVDAYRLQYPEIDNAIDNFSLMLEEQAFENAIDPPPYLKSKIITSVKENDESAVPVIPLSAHRDTNNADSFIFYRKWRMAAAASVILLLCSAALNYYLYNKYSQQNAAYVALLSERNTLQASNNVYQTTLQKWQSASEMMADPAMTMVKMKDPAGKANNMATVFWNTRSKDVYLMPNRLPHPATGKQYQLWALVDGKPVDAGMLDGECTGTCKMKSIPKAQAFAITLEKEGGSSSPTMEAMYVMGNV